MKALVKVILYQPIFNALIFLVWLMPYHSVGLAIIILTVLIRLILLPSSAKSLKQQKRLQELQPEIQQLQEQYKDDKQKQSQELMALYQRNKVNPLGSCLPLLIQFPILIVLYYVFMHGLDTSRFDLLYSFVPRPELINTMFLGIDLAKPDLWVMPIIAGVLQFIQTRMMMPAQPKKEDGKNDPQAMQAMVTKQMMYLFPLMTIFIARGLPAALPLYWIITTLFAIGQQWMITRQPSESLISLPVANNDKKTKNTITKGGVEVTVRRKDETRGN